ncbi:pyridoxal phosphate-dependent transferase [Fomitopsis serialis]|uniref:pyridoxal phosphate-dependent transferase n=1 Tax=Fomitopsis serialis TaxID=139415 RepID=UPI002008B794|nr:pyridoxal phosphate-dependent transferase [Neoantrodia serialis]KAH9937474.1 pyridoxal phosphate-dependent transferase [Neoantrodia serialis]
MAAHGTYTPTKVIEEAKLDILAQTQEDDNAKWRRQVSRSFLSPTAEMYVYAVRASLGDDVYDEPCTKLLEQHMAKLTGKEALSCSPDTPKQPPYSVLCDHRAHIASWWTAFHSGAQLDYVIPLTGISHLDDIKEHVVLGSDITGTCPTAIIELENTLNGTIIPQQDVIEISEFAHANDIIMHLDGARIWHVAAETGTPLLCFSKGLGMSTSVLLWFRKLFGGGMRQTGFMSASAAYALTHHFPLLPGVHALTRKLEKGLEEIGVRITSRAETCMVFYDPSPIGVSYAEIIDRASKLPEPIKLGGSRLVVHIQTAEDTVDDFLAVIRKLAQEKKDAGFVYSEQQQKANGVGRSSIYVKVKASDLEKVQHQ